MRKFGLIGYPLGHSFSQRYFNEKFLNEQVNDFLYENFPLSNIKDLPELLLSQPELEGLNVTIPHKSSVINFLDRISEEAKEIGAVNVIKISRAGGKINLAGYNSDAYGFTESLRPHMKDKPVNAMVLGTGGSSKAVCYALRKMGINVLSVSRKPAAGQLSYSSLDKSVFAKTRLIVNTTPLGMYPDIGSKPEIDYDQVGSGHILYDLVYNPGETAFLKEGRKRGCITISGLKMLHLQAEKSWQIWNSE